MSRGMSRRRAAPLETVWVEVPESALEAYEAAFLSACETVGFFLADEDARIWRVEGVREVGADPAPLLGALLLAELTSGVSAVPGHTATEADGWLLRTQQSFPPVRVGRRFLVRGTHEAGRVSAGLIGLTLDAGLAFGSGEHGSTRGCLRALEAVARRRPSRAPRQRVPQLRVLDLGTGSGILAMAAAQLLRVPVLATDIEPWSVRVAGQNAQANRVGRLVRPALADGWRSRRVSGRFDLVLANILARPLCRMARDLALHLAPGGTAILAGLLDWQAQWVLGAHRRQGLVLERRFAEGPWVTLVVRKAG